jgi:hypothetical protein
MRERTSKPPPPGAEDGVDEATAVSEVADVVPGVRRSAAMAAAPASKRLTYPQREKKNIKKHTLPLKK